MALNRSISAPHSWRAVVAVFPLQPRRTASASRGIVSSHEQIKIFLTGSGILASLPRLAPD
jgi:hypothetical protein